MNWFRRKFWHKIKNSFPLFLKIIFNYFLLYHKSSKIQSNSYSQFIHNHLLTIKLFLLKLGYYYFAHRGRSLFRLRFLNLGVNISSKDNSLFWFLNLLFCETIVNKKRFLERDGKDVEICFFGWRSSQRKDFGEKLVFALETN